MSESVDFLFGLGAIIFGIKVFRGFMTSSNDHMGMRKLPAGCASLVRQLLLSVLMTAVVSFVSVAMSAGITGGLILEWLRAWGVSWLIAFPTLLAVFPLTQRLTAAIVDAE